MEGGGGGGREREVKGGCFGWYGREWDDRERDEDEERRSEEGGDGRGGYRGALVREGKNRRERREKTIKVGRPNKGRW